LPFAWPPAVKSLKSVERLFDTAEPGVSSKSIKTARPYQIQARSLAVFRLDRLPVPPVAEAKPETPEPKPA
jgi:hypothetical protein